MERMAHPTKSRTMRPRMMRPTTRRKSHTMEDSLGGRQRQRRTGTLYHSSPWSTLNYDKWL